VGISFGIESEKELLYRVKRKMIILAARNTREK